MCTRVCVYAVHAHVCVCLCKHLNTSAGTYKSQRHQIPAELELQEVVGHLTWALGAKLCSLEEPCALLPMSHLSSPVS